MVQLLGLFTAPANELAPREMTAKDPWWHAHGRLIFAQVRAQAYSSHRKYSSSAELERALTEHARGVIDELDSMKIPAARCPYSPSEIDQRVEKIGRDISQWVWERFPREENPVA